MTHLKSADLRAGNDVLNVERLGLADGAAILAGRDNDHVVLRDLDTGADVKLDLALGNDSLTLRGVRLNGNAKVTGGDGSDSALLSEVTGDGAVTVELGLGNDSLVIARSWLKQAVLHLGRGDDLFAAYDTQLTDSEVNTGIGRDLVVLVGAAMDGTANWSLGAGDDGVVARRSSFAVGSHIDGGEGLDTSVDRTGTLTTDLFKNF